MNEKKKERVIISKYIYMFIIMNEPRKYKKKKKKSEKLFIVKLIFICYLLTFQHHQIFKLCYMLLYEKVVRL
jgi:hypothetical protein